jgi:predicted NBD/HSP70 family sugar kinase
MSSTPDALADRLALAPRAVPEDARRANRSLLLRALHHGGPASRADLAKLVGLAPATVSAVIKDLLDADLVHELGRTSGSVGKPATMVGVAPHGRHLLAISLSEPDAFVGTLVDLGGDVTLRRRYERAGRTGDAAVDLVGDICDDLLATLDRPLLGIGIASPGIVDQDGVVRHAARLDWHDVPLAARIARRTGHPVHATNDANAAALSELVYGHSQSTDFVLVRVGQGVGAGLVLAGALHRGPRSAAGEIGHVVVVPDGDPCTCGKRGCLETVISAPLLAGRLDPTDAAARATLRRAGEHLGAALATVVSALDIDDVVISGSTPVRTEPFRTATVEAIAVRTMAEISHELTVRESQFGDDDVILGAAALVLDQELGVR